MRVRRPNDITVQEAIRLQQRLALLVDTSSRLPRNISSIVGCDASYFDTTTLTAAVSVNYHDLSVQRRRLITTETTFPYVPGLLAFREGPGVIRTIRSLRSTSYVCMVDGHGLAHPRKFGLACFVGLVLDRPTIGVAKSLLYGSARDNRIVDGRGSTIAELITLPGSGKTIYVSVGHKISLGDAVEVVERCLTPQGPLPIRLAHEEVTKRKWQIKRSNPAFS